MAVVKECVLVLFAFNRVKNSNKTFIYLKIG